MITTDNSTTPINTLPERCNSLSEQLDQLADKFEQIGWEGHRLKIVDLAGHLCIYAHQLDAKGKGDRS